MTDNEIMKALKCCSTEHCKKRDCPLFECTRNTNDCIEHLSNNALDLINRLKAEKEALIAGQETLQKALAAKNAEIERFEKIETTVNEFWCVLQKFSKEKFKETPTLEELLEYIEHAKVEVIKEFAEKTNEMITDIYNKHIFSRDNDLNDEEKDAIINFSDDITYRFDNLVKEMTEPSLLDKNFGGDTE